MIDRRRLERGGWILLSAVSLPGCGALALDRLAEEPRMEARQRAERAMSLARSGQTEPARAEQDAASAALDRALCLASDPTVVADLLAMRYQFDVGLAQPEQARATLARLERIAPDSPITAMVLADSRATQNDFEGAQRALEHALRFTPGTPEILWFAGLLALQLDDVERAAIRFAALRATGTASEWEVSGRIGEALALHGIETSRIAAVDAWRDAILADPTQSTFLMVFDELGSRATELEKRLRSIAEDASLKYDGDPGVAFAKAYIDRASGFPEAALAAIDRALVRGAGPFEIDLLWLACRVHKDLDQPESALVRARTLLDRRPWHLEALLLFAESTIRGEPSSPDRDRALKYVGEARAHFESSRRMVVESAPRETREIRAQLAEYDRYLGLLDQVERALEQR